MIECWVSEEGRRRKRYAGRVTVWYSISVVLTLLQDLVDVGGVTFDALLALLSSCDLINREK